MKGGGGGEEGRAEGGQREEEVGKLSELERGGQLVKGGREVTKAKGGYRRQKYNCTTNCRFCREVLNVLNPAAGVVKIYSPSQ